MVDSSIPLALYPPDELVSIRPARMGDITALHEDCWPDRSITSIGMLVERAQKLANRGRGLGVVVESDDGAIVGYGQLTLWATCGEVSDLVVVEALRGNGLGTTIIQYLARAAGEMQARCLEIGAALSNPRALALYRRLGFVDNRSISLDLGKGNETIIYLRLEIRQA